MASENTKKEMLRNGNILKEYTQTHFLSVSPLPLMEKVLFSIVKQGTKGKDEKLFFMDLEEFRLLCTDLVEPSGQRKLKESMEHQYPDAYKYVSGKDGSRRLNLGGGEKGIRIQIQEKKENAWDSRMVVVSYKSLLSMKFYFELVMGLIPVSRYYRQLQDVFWEEYEQREKKRSRNTEAAQKDGPQSAPQETQDAPGQDLKTVTVQTKGAVKKSGNTFFCPVTDSEKEFNLCFTPEHLPAMGDKWQKFQEKAADGVKIRINASINGNRMEFVSIA